MYKALVNEFAWNTLWTSPKPPSKDGKLQETGDQAPTASGFDFYGATNSRLQVSDGEVMYTMMKVGDDIRATRVNVKEVQRSVANLPNRPVGADWLKDLGLVVSKQCWRL